MLSGKQRISPRGHYTLVLAVGWPGRWEFIWLNSLENNLKAYGTANKPLDNPLFYTTIVLTSIRTAT
jgi:hypothetical protein